MIIKAQLRNKQEQILPHRCDIVCVVELPRDEFSDFQCDLLKDRSFITELLPELQTDEKDVLPCMLVLEEGSSDGILVDPQGYSYARYSAYVSGARQMAAPERIRRFQNDLRVLSKAEVDIICAKHTLWMHDLGGEQADFRKCCLRDIDLSNRDLVNAMFDGSQLNNVTLDKTDISYASFIGATLRNCEASGFTAHSADFKNAGIYDCDMSCSFFEGCNLTDATIADSNLTEVNMENCCLENTRFIGNEDYRFETTECSTDEEEWESEQAPPNMTI
ncbi:pentapeptide repeat-containing protein [Intestinimonas massiliensis]|uniref:Pentapeptide repeat-containing protein n=1 Tax=Intestinimonas massiliensis (ex Afouda et al. 2020) TaxID=1673721 RepID=A0AAW5JP56_9FIRM|nr:pentapeptide repeat-containing protein [Intestinimonas massiliensis (ex Afouda et al. 2020)]MCQ4770296.1 pentapeptide repeat-containing protein [Intestinimonas massiliensis (ex Afouda et al. 2020)]